MSSISLAAATQVIEGALACARKLELQPLTIVVLDPGGHVVASAREDNSGILRPQIATGKAWGALGMGRGTRELARRAESHPGFFSALSAASEGRIFPVPGGVLVRDGDARLLGAVGVSGDLPDRDEQCALAGINQAGLIGQCE